MPRPHGNSLRQSRISIRPKTFCFYKEESVKGNSDKQAHKIYKEAVTEGHSVTDKPRNIRQVQYIREKARTEERLSKYAITNLQGMAYEDEPKSRKNLYIQAHTIPLHRTCRMPESALCTHALSPTPSSPRP